MEEGHAVEEIEQVEEKYLGGERFERLKMEKLRTLRTIWNQNCLLSRVRSRQIRR